MRSAWRDAPVGRKSTSLIAGELRLEPHPQRKLHLARGPCAEGLTECRVDVNPVRKVDSGRVNGIELCVIENVVCLGPECENALFVAQIEIPEQAHVEIVPSGTAHYGLVCISQGAAGKLNTRCVEKLIRSLVPVSQVGITTQIDSLYIAAARQIREHNWCDPKRRSGREGRDPGDLPALCRRNSGLDGRLYPGYIVLPIDSQDVCLVEA
jgi:hypothetical protein